MQTEDNFLSDNKGFLLVKDNRVQLILDNSNSIPPVLVPGEGVKVYYDGEEKTDSFPVDNISKLAIEIPDLCEEASIQIRLAPNKMEAEAKVTPRKIIKQKLKDQSAATRLTLKAVPGEVQERPVLTKDDIKEKLKEKGILYGLDDKAIEVLAAKPDGVWHRVAKGKPSQDGKDGYLEIIVEHEIKAVSYNQEVDRVNYREKINLPMVKEGDILARIHPPQLGEPGYNVLGEEIKPQPVKNAYFRCKKGTATAKDKLTIRATIKGRPVVEGKQKNIFSVSPLYYHSGDVDIRSGNLKFAGDLSISGNILEGMKAEAEGDLVVMGNTAGAEVFAGGNVVFHRNLINSRVQAGLKKVFFQEMFDLLKEWSTLLEMMTAGLARLQDSMEGMGKNISKKQVGKLVQLLVEKKYNNLPVITEKIIKLLKENRITVFPELKESMLEVVHYFTGHGFLEIKNQDHLLLIMAKAKDVLEAVERNLGFSGDITAFYVQNSQVTAGGNITIIGSGSYNSSFKAGGNVEIKGIMRGGEIISQGKVAIGEAGSPQIISKQGLVIIPSKGSVQIYKAFENFEVRVGTKFYRFQENMSRVKVTYDKQDDCVKVSHF